ncbi:exodeoxyribonuclease V subunit alpha [Nakamurella sp. A5-74]|uniref:RecBCD enzyme subunit RecD n=1 Tax=Nakamurella sp. A5-74 TaxID=3158264 RepID=A0AAU8DT40_9ACTN
MTRPTAARIRDEFAVDRVRAPMADTLAAFNDAEVLIAADVHVARQLGLLAGETDDDVLLAVALAVRAVRQGSVCVDLFTVRDAVLGESADVADLPVAGADDHEVGDPELARQLARQYALDWPDAERWRALVTASALVEVCPDDAVPPADGGPGRPLRWFGGRLYLDRYWRQERAVAAELVTRMSVPDDALDEQTIIRRTAAIQRLFPEPENESRQRIGAAVSASRRLAVLAGGPGTGKTTAVARMIAVLADREGPAPRIALAAPTGKAAARLGQAVRDEIATFSVGDRARIGDVQASTLHRLLGWRPGSRSRFKHDARQHLPHDVVVVDESSMVPLTMMARLLEALRPEARLLLVGDPDQLASVEAGAVLGDIVARAEALDRAGDSGGGRAGVPGADDLLGRLCPVDEPTLDDVDRRAAAAGVTRLTHRFRFGEEIGRLADAIRRGDADQAIAVLGAGGSRIDWVDREADERDPAMAELRDDVVRAARTLTAAALDGDVVQALRAMDEHRLLCAHRSGPFGAAWWARVIQRWIAADRAVRGEPLTATDRRTGADSWWEPGRPLLITDNDYELGLFNGDTGVVIKDGQQGLVAAFGDARDPVTVRPGRLSGVQSVYAMTIHKSQGSQFKAVTVILPPAQSPLLTRELLYTAATRASERVRIIGSAHAVRTAIARPVSRASGLRG